MTTGGEPRSHEGCEDARRFFTQRMGGRRGHRGGGGDGEPLEVALGWMEAKKLAIALQLWAACLD